ncbi:MAG: aldo/keto reductase [Clostridiales bacterium]|jgi:aryl-alcohol dehydrogenase-like predicted oxidoreductase|nr:aldo/keto reductase [Clostridiales bacterium]
MEFKSLGRTGMKVSRLCVGSWNFGTYTEEREAFRIMDAALDAGINYIDTANAYPDVGMRGISEQIIGRWFALGNGRREKTILATKVYSFTEDINDGPNDGHGLSIYKIRRHIEASLRRLQTDHIELYQMHHVDRDVTWEEVLDAFYALYLQGKIDYVGGCNFAGLDHMRAHISSKEKGILGIVSEQHKYNLLCRLPELELIPTVNYLGIGLLPYSPLAEGSLAGKRKSGDIGKSRRRAIDTSTEKGLRLHTQIEAYSALCGELGESEAHVALAWLLQNPAVTSVIMGPRTVDQVTDMTRALEIQLDRVVLNRLDEIFPGPGGAAPEAYAW